MTSIWEKESFFEHQDIIIVGSGFAGLWSAYFLCRKQRKAKITIVEKEPIPTGASTRNAGFACFGSLSELLADEQALGTEAMLTLVEMRQKGLERITKSFSKKALDFEKTGGYELYTQSEQRKTEDLEAQVKYLNKSLKPLIKVKPFSLLGKKSSRFGFKNITHIIQNTPEGQLHPGKLARALIQYLQCKGVQILNGVEVKSYEEQGEIIHVQTNHIYPLTTNQILICNNGLSGGLLPSISTMPARGQVFLTSEIKNLPWKGTFHFDEGYYYFRNLGKKVLLGGARNSAFAEEETFSLETSDTVQQELERFLKEVILPGQTFTIDHRWSGTMGMGQSKLPDLSRVSENVYAVVNLGGIGVAMAPYLGEEAAKLMAM
ncbi:MAG: FAD-binding oxidoreductase [Chitinophagaceae bacterium]|nr:FAD-binding oxidoreductase [Chitinophagaceae bacterium]